MTELTSTFEKTAQKVTHSWGRRQMSQSSKHAIATGNVSVRHGTGLLIMRGSGMVPAPRPSWLPRGLPWNKQQPGEVFYGIQIDGAGMATKMSPQMAAMLPPAWQAHLSADRDVPAAVLLGSGSLTSDAAFVDYDADVLQWVAAFTAVLEHSVGHQRPAWRCFAQRTRQGRFMGLQRAHVSLVG